MVGARPHCALQRARAAPHMHARFAANGRRHTWHCSWWWPSALEPLQPSRPDTPRPPRRHVRRPGCSTTQASATSRAAPRSCTRTSCPCGRATPAGRRGDSCRTAGGARARAGCQARAARAPPCVPSRRINRAPPPLALLSSCPPIPAASPTHLWGCRCGAGPEQLGFSDHFPVVVRFEMVGGAS